MSEVLTLKSGTALLVSALVHALVLVALIWGGAHAIVGAGEALTVDLVPVYAPDLPSAKKVTVSHARAAVTPPPRHDPPPSAVTGPTESRPPTSAPSATGGGDASAPELSRYLSEVMRKIDAGKRYPRVAIEREEEGKVILDATIDRGGRLVASRIKTSSGFGDLDRAALDSLQNGGRFPEIPAALSAPLQLIIPVNFTLNR